jgi:gluconolactonase
VTHYRIEHQGQDIVDGKGWPTANVLLMGTKEAGLADGIGRMRGNIWVGAGYRGWLHGVHIFAPNGDRIGIIKMPEVVANVCFGGTKRNLLFMTGSQSLYAVYVEAQGAHIT